mgnify:FL=1|jgi:hypothetical protein|tara:strand:- start:416 stop:1240 length:825 start_codon:yes stop_codon:yes gene_type:complete
MSIPIIFFHVGGSDYLEHTLKQAVATNPNSDVYLLGDVENSKYSEIVNFVPYENFFEDVWDFKKMYTHMSTNDPAYEMICIVRWFIINRFCKKQNIDKFFCCDSDVLLYCDITEEQKKFADYRLTLTHNISAGITFVNDLAVLDEFHQLCKDIYSKKDMYNFNRCKLHYKNLQNSHRAGGVCDMTIWWIYRNIGNPGDYGETSAIINDSVFDHNINGDDGYETENSLKKVYWEDNIPHCKKTWLNKKIKFNCLHFQGQPAKALIKEYSTYDKLV